MSSIYQNVTLLFWISVILVLLDVSCGIEALTLMETKHNWFDLGVISSGS